MCHPETDSVRSKLSDQNGPRSLPLTPEMKTSDPPCEEAVLEVENCIETYRTIAEWIRFADAKAGVTPTVNGILLGLLIPTLKTYLTDNTTVHPLQSWTTIVVGLFVG